MNNKKPPDTATNQQTILSTLFSSKSLTESQVLEIKGGLGPGIEPDVP